MYAGVISTVLVLMKMPYMTDVDACWNLQQCLVHNLAAF